MFYVKMHDEDDNELPRYEEEEEGLEHPHDEIVGEVEEIILEDEPGEEEDPAPAAPAPRKATPSRKAKKAKKPARKRAKAKGKKKKSGSSKARAKKSGKRKKR